MSDAHQIKQELLAAMREAIRPYGWSAEVVCANGRMVLILPGEWTPSGKLVRPYQEIDIGDSVR